MEELYGIDLFSFNEEVETIAPGACQFNNVEWCLESMKKHNGLNVQRFLNGTIYILEDNVLIESMYAYEIPELRILLEKELRKQQ